MMKKYIVKWDAGYGDNYESVETENEEEAKKYVYELWRDEIESNMDYCVVGEWTEELAEEYGVE